MTGVGLAKDKMGEGDDGKAADKLSVPPRPWADVVYEYSQDTTFHGVRYITAKESYRIRRILWFVAVGAAITLVLILMISRMLVYFEYPMSVSLDVSYTDSLAFPAVTICNQNLFKLSKIQEAGLYDEVSKHLESLEALATNTVLLDEYAQIGEGCLGNDYRADVTDATFKYDEVTLSGCKYLCQYLHTMTCTLIVFLPNRRSCILQPLQDIPLGVGTWNSTLATIYRRQRITDNSTVKCDFESDCSLLQNSADQENWLLLEASFEKRVQRDHTTLSPEGHMYYVLATDRPSSTEAGLYTDYKNTTGLCLELYYQLRGPSQLVVSVRGEDYIEIPLTSDGKEEESWQWFLVYLKDGIYQILITAITAAGEVSGVLLDDVLIQPCEDFISDCKETVNGRDYLGCLSISQSNRECYPWTEVEKNLTGLEFPLGGSEEQGNHCRTASISGNATYPVEWGSIPDKPWCVTELGFELCNVSFCDSWVRCTSCASTGLEFPLGGPKEQKNLCRSASISGNAMYPAVWGSSPDRTWCLTELGFELCSVSYCDCSDQPGLLVCDNGQCYPETLQCDGKVNCEDQSDETTQCESQRHVECNFTNTFICGYDTESNAANHAKWIWTKNDYFSKYFDANGTAGYMDIDKAAAFSGMTIPMATSDFNASVPHCLSFKYIISASNQSSIPILSVYLRNNANFYTGRRLWLSSTYWGDIAQFSVPEMNGPDMYKLDFVGMLGDASTTLISVSSVQFIVGACAVQDGPPCAPEDIRCGSGECIGGYTTCNGQVDCMDESDERELCSLPATVQCAFDVDQPHNCGYTTRSTWKIFQWNRLPNPFTDDDDDYMFCANNSLELEICSHAHAVAVSPLVNVSDSTCMTFRYFMSANLTLTASNVSQSLTLANFSVDGGWAMHKAFIDLPLGEYQLLWNVMDLDTGSAGGNYNAYQPNGEEDGEYNTFRAAIDDIELHPSNCSKLRYPWNGLACNFSGEVLCGWKSDNIGPVRETRVRAGDWSYGLAIPAIDEVSPYATISSPPVHIPSARCMIAMFYCARCGTSYQLNINLNFIDGRGSAANISDLASDIEITQITEIPPGEYSVSFTAFMAPGIPGVLQINSVALQEKTDAGCNIQVNLAERQRSWQHEDEEDEDQQGLDPILAVDTDIVTCTVVEPHGDVWWAVDLGLSYKLERVEVVSVNETAQFVVAVSFQEPPVTDMSEFSNRDYTVCGEFDGAATSGDEAFILFCQEDAVGQYVFLYSSTGPLPFLCEVRIFGKLNAAGNRNTGASESLNDSERAVDDNDNSNMEDNSCTRMDEDAQVWWAVDLGRVYLITKVQVTNVDIDDREDQDGGTHVKLSASNVSFVEQSTIPNWNDGNYKYCGSYDSSPWSSPANTVLCEDEVLGRYLYIYLSERGRIVLCEVRVYGDIPNVRWDDYFSTAAPTTPPAATTAKETTTAAAAAAAAATEMTTITRHSLAWSDPADFSFPQLLTTPQQQSPIIGNGERHVIETSDSLARQEQHTDNISEPGSIPLVTQLGPTSCYDDEHLNSVAVFTDITGFYTYAGHQESDLIYKCLWNGQQCPNNSITTTLTDLGLCYTFNADSQNMLRAENPGAGFGLSLIINIEEYEYISGPTIDAGIKVHAYEQDDIPLVQNLGFAVSPGQHSLAAVQCNYLKSLPDPYGSCGESKLDLYEKGTNYTFSRCSQQCAAYYANTNCTCTDAYMPGEMRNCNLTEYLTCILPIQYVNGFRYSDCNCPDNCELKYYGIGLSYASLSTNNVESLLDSNRTELTMKYHRALELEQRVLAQLLGKTVEYMRNVTVALETFMWLLMNSTETNLKMVNIALLKLHESVLQDVGNLTETVAEVKIQFDSEISSTVDPLIDEIQQVEFILKYIAYRVLEGPEDPGLYAFEAARMHFDLIHGMLKRMSGVRNLLQHEDRIPDKLWSRMDREIFCIKLFESESERYEELQDHIDSAIDDWDSNLAEEGDTGWPAKANRMVLNRLANLDNLMSCTYEYKNVTATSYEILTEMKETLENMVETEYDFDYDGVFDNVKDDVDAISSNITWLESLLLNYSRNRITKLELSEMIDQTVIDAIEQSLENVVNEVKTRVLMILESMTDEAETKLLSWLLDALEALNIITVYFDSKYVENDARQLQIWRKPLAELNTPDVLQYEYPESQTWQIWKREVSLAQLLAEGTAKKEIEDILETYTNVLYTEMNDVRTALSVADKDVMSSLTEFVKDLEEFKIKSQLDNTFILSNFLKIDVYYPWMKCETAKQFAAYSATNFLSEVGGYMGLLIGASILTLFEILDLLLYNLILKCIASGRRKVDKYRQDSSTEDSSSSWDWHDAYRSDAESGISYNSLYFEWS